VKNVSERNTVLVEHVSAVEITLAAEAHLAERLTQ